MGGGRLETTGDLRACLDADSRAPCDWLGRTEEAFGSGSKRVATSGRFRYYDWDPLSRALVALYDVLVAPPLHWLLQDVLGWGAILYGGGFCVRRSALEAIGGFDTTIEFHGEDTNLGRRLAQVGRVTLARRFWVHTSARRYKALGRGAVFQVYIRNFWSEILHHRPRDLQHREL